MGSRIIGIKFAIAVVIVEIVFIGLIEWKANYLRVENEDGEEVPVGPENQDQYPNFQDVNVMIFAGFGFLMTFLRRYGFSSVGLNLFISAICIQWTFLVRGLIHEEGDEFSLGVGDMVTANFGTATVLISFGAVLGKVSPLQLLIMGLIEVPLAQANEYIGYDKYYAVDVGESMFIHMFGAYFGMAVAFVLFDPDVEESRKEGSVYHSDIFSMIGTIFLWIFWPSFNGGFAGDLSQVAYVNTFLSLCACTAMAFAFSALLDGKSKFDMVHIQNSTLAGGVAVGACANMPMEPFVAMIIGSVAGVVSVVGYRFITPFLSSKLRIHDTCGVHNLHGMPAWIAAIAAAILCLDIDPKDWGRANINGTFHEIEVAPSGDLIGRSEEKQAGYQMAAAVTTLAIAVGGGLVTGIILKIPIWDAPKEENLFEDGRHWHLPDDAENPPQGVAENNYKVDTPM